MFRRSASEMRVVILAPVGRDAQLLASTLIALTIDSEITPDANLLLPKLKEGAGAVIVAEEALNSAHLKVLGAWLASQPPWSDLPFIVLTASGRPTAQNARRAEELQTLGNVTLIERPVRPETVQSALRAALRARGRQYEMRARQEELLRANADLEQFAHSASHDLREPIRSISVYSELLKKHYGQFLDQTGIGFLGFVQSGAARMETLLQDLLSYAQASNIPDQAPELICAKAALDASLKSLAGAIQNSNAKIEAGEMPRVRILSTHLEQLFQNLIGNAIKYRREDPPLVRIAARLDNKQWVFSIEDNGIGIAEQYKEMIFGLFKRLHTNQAYSGTGMGLAICQRIVERYHGRIWVESQPGRGSYFFFTIPG
jgi:signal transduction histidine kinase